MSQLSYKDCVKIQGYLKLNLIQSEIARYLNVNQSTISRELKKCKKLGIEYDADIARKQRKEFRSKANTLIHTKIITGSKLAIYIEDKLKLYWSPEQIAGRWKLETQETITHPTIYAYIYANLKDLVIKYFRRKGKKYRKGSNKKPKIPNRISIHERPEIIEKRERIGDFEGDTIVGSNKGDRIVTNVCRKSKYLIGGLIKQEKGNSLAIGTSVETFKRFKVLPKGKLHSLTLDNGVEFCDREYLQEMLGIDVYFADPYSSWQRGTNENTNGLIRQFT